MSSPRSALFAPGLVPPWHIDLPSEMRTRQVAVVGAERLELPTIHWESAAKRAGRNCYSRTI